MSYGSAVVQYAFRSILWFAVHYEISGADVEGDGGSVIVAIIKRMSAVMSSRPHS